MSTLTTIQEGLDKEGRKIMVAHRNSPYTGDQGYGVYILGPMSKYDRWPQWTPRSSGKSLEDAIKEFNKLI